MRPFLAACAVLFCSFSISAQGPSADWRTISTAHFRVHYPVEYEAWTLRAASRLESIFDAVSAEVGYRPETVTDVLVMNPMARPNGLAWPLLDTPRIILFTEPPSPDEQIGAYSSWIDLLAVHEVAHVVHMMRPSRNPARRFIEHYLVPLNAITLGAPRWVLEGYATVIEGRLTGAGRPGSTARALILRQWAAHGRLPEYRQLDGDRRFLGMSMAYLAGSAYLEWLEARSGAGSLPKLWRRLTARQRRSFDGAFEGVFGDSPERLYGQFVGELTASAVAAGRAAPIREGELWQETKWGSGDPAVARDDRRIVVVVREREKPARMVVWSTGPAGKEEKKYRERIEKLMQRDPDDVPPVRTKPLPRDPLRSFTAPDGGDLSNPRWMPGGSSILVTHRQPDREGFEHHDLFIWTVETGAWHRVTRLADVRDADPLPDGRSAIGVRNRHGFSQLASVDLATGTVVPLTDPSIEVVYDHPRVSPDGTRLAYAAHRGGTWTIVVRDLRSGDESTIAPEPGDAFASPEWLSNDALVATLLSRGFADLQRLTLDGTRTPMTRTRGGAFSPAPEPGGRVFFMSIDPEGFVLRAADPGVAPAAPPLDAALVPALPPSPRAAAPFAVQNVEPGRPYGFGAQELTLIGGATFAPAHNGTEIGIRLGDVAGRIDTLAVASFGSGDAPRGIAAASAWRGWPVEVSAHLFRAEDARADRSGGELRAAWDRHAPQSRLRLEGGVLGGEPFDLGFGEAAFQVFRRYPTWSTSQDVSVGFEAGSFDQWRGSVGGSVRRGAARLSVEYEYRRLTGGDGQRIELGGLPSTVVPRSAFAFRAFEPGLRAGSGAGDVYQAVRVGATVPGIPLTLFYRRHELEDDVAVAGAELAVSSEPFPLVRLPGFDATLGVARPVGGLVGRDTTWWLGLRWRP